MARTRWPPGSVNPGLLHRTGRSDRQRRWVPKSLGPGRQIDSQDNQQASADSQAKPGPRPDPTPAPPQTSGSRAETTHLHPPCRIWIPTALVGICESVRSDYPLGVRVLSAGTGATDRPVGTAGLRARACRRGLSAGPGAAEMPEGALGLARRRRDCEVQGEVLARLDRDLSLVGAPVGTPRDHHV
jgi:hypothetical protein